MQFVLEIFIIALITLNCAIDLPCDFNFDQQNGYFCRVVNFTNEAKHVYVTKVIGSHLYQTDRNYRNRTNKSVVRVVMWNTTVHFLPGNLTIVFPHLKILHVKKCGLRKLTRHMEYHALRKFFLGFNDIDHIPDNYFWHFCKLEILSLYGNRISKIHKMAFRDLISLKRLSLGNNRLTALNPELFVNCSSLEHADLDNNFLEQIDGRLFTNLTSLKRIYLRHNHLYSIGNDFLSTLLNLEFALFENNACINVSFPEFKWNQQKSLESIQSAFRENCTIPVVITTASASSMRPTTKPPPRKKPKRMPQRNYYFENCKWNTPKGHRYF